MSEPNPEAGLDLAQYSIDATAWGGVLAVDVICLRCQEHDYQRRRVEDWITDGETVTLAEVLAAIEAHHETHHRKAESP